MPKKSAERPPSIISSDKLQKLYTTMLKCRILQLKTRGLDGISSWKSKEAVAAAMSIDLQPEDAIISFSGMALPLFLKGAPLRSVLRQRFGSKKRSKLLDSNTECALATGIACSRQHEDRDSVTVAFLSGRPDASDSGRQALGFAGEHKLPVLYVYCGPSVDAMHTYVYGFPVIPVDGADAVAVYRVAHECTVRARQGGGPSVIACNTSSGTDDPIHKMEQYLSAKGLFTKDLKQTTVRKFGQSIAVAQKALPEKRQKSAFTFVV